MPVEAKEKEGIGKAIPIEYFSLGMEDIEDDMPKEVFIPKYKKKIKYNIGDVVTTPKGRGRVVTQPTEYGKVYTVHLTELDDVEIFEEKELKKVAGSFEEDVKRLHQQVQTSDTSLSDDEVLKQTIEKLKEEKAEQGVFIEPDEYSVKEVLRQGKLTETDLKDFILTDNEKQIVVSESDILGETQYIAVGSAYKKGYDPVWLYIRFHSGISEDIFDTVLQTISKTFGYDSITEVSGEKTIWVNFMTDVTMSRIDNIVKLIQSIIRKKHSHKGRRPPRDLGYSGDAWIRVWIDESDLEFDGKIEEIKKMNISLDEKIVLAKRRAYELALEQVADAEGIKIEVKALELTTDRINWEEIFEPEEEKQGNKKQAEDDYKLYDVAIEQIDDFGKITYEKNHGLDEDEILKYYEVTPEEYTGLKVGEVKEIQSTRDTLYEIKRVANRKTARRLRDVRRESMKMADIYRPDVTKTEWYSKGEEDKTKAPKVLSNYPNKALFDTDIEYQHALDAYWKGYGKSLVTSMLIYAVKIGWLRDDWISKTNRILDALSEVSDVFKEERKDNIGPGMNLFNYYSTSRYEELERPLREEAITKSQAKKLLEDLISQFKIELFAAYGITNTKKVEEIIEETPKEIEPEKEVEKESNTEEVGFSELMDIMDEDINTILKKYGGVLKAKQLRFSDESGHPISYQPDKGAGKFYIIFDSLGYGSEYPKNIDAMVKDLETTFKANDSWITSNPWEIVLHYDFNVDKEAVSMDEVVMYGDSNIYPYKGTGAGMPSSSDMSRLDGEIPAREIKQL